MSDTETGTYGALETTDGQYRVRFERRLAHAPAKVWRALTEDEHLEAWFPTTIEGERRAGAPLRFSFREHAMEPFVGRMLACEPPTLLELTWGPDVLRLELVADGDGTLLTLTDLIDPNEQGKAARDSVGWHECLDLLAFDLAHHGDGSTPPFVGERWSEVNERYVADFPADASTVGPPQEYLDTMNEQA